MRQASKAAEACLWALAILALGYCSSIEVRAWLAQRAGEREINAGSGSTSPRIPAGGLVGRLEIPRLGMSVVVFQGTDTNTLDLGAGHWSGSALPGETGNLVLAAHRDTFFRGLRNIRRDDVVNITTTDGTQHYLVVSTRIVNPSDLEVLAPTPKPSLTLITCYPFEYFGHAPQRFIVRATLNNAPVGRAILPAAGY